MAFIVFMERAQRRLLIQYRSARSATRCSRASPRICPNQPTSGVIPPIFASSLLLLPTTIASFNAPARGRSGFSGW
ncbi:MAG: hypothetical protein R3D69_17050 [Xanthobacteraceae bacterium]